MNRTLEVMALGLLCAACGEAADVGTDEEEATERQSLAAAAEVASLEDVCPSARQDALCVALRAAEATKGAAAVAAYAEARAAIAARVATEPAGEVAGDPAVRYFVRERALALLVHGAAEAPASVNDWWRAAEETLARHFPAYEPWTVAMAREWMPPEPIAGCDGEVRAAVLYFPGVVRVGHRREMDLQLAALAGAFPCVRGVRVETASFVAPEINAAEAEKTVAALDAEVGRAVPLHLVGYSQGARNALETLVRYPAIAARTRTVLTLNAAARGSEVADVLYAAVQALDSASGGCNKLPAFARTPCKAIAGWSARPADVVLGAIAFAMGIPVGDLEAFIAAEDAIAPAATLGDFFRTHLPGVRSLTTADAASFWKGPAHALPQGTLYFAFRSAITDRKNLPLSNWINYEILRRAGGFYHFNDMQMRLANQSLGGAVEDREVVGRLAEGNHWQWELLPGDVPESVMPSEMVERIPHEAMFVAHLRAVAEIGLLY
jgi:pimeloyl-ACP methyl ester carboxylesterase